jgi:aspartyl-tRNA(Asn)/glutamyl-tRNA(Gln) amidotransferase subunit B
VRWIDICDGNMQEGSFRCDANVSVRPTGTDKLGTRCEIKNLNSFRFLERAIHFEVQRQIEIIEDGGKIIQETRLYDPDRDETRPMRSKEDAQDYRYFPDPDLLPLTIGREWIEQVRSALPELPDAMRARFQQQLGLTGYDAAVLTASREIATYFEQAVQALPNQGKLIANWVMGELSGRLNKEGLEVERSPVTPSALAGLLRRIADGTLSGKMAKDVFDALWSGEGDADRIIEARGLQQISDSGAIERIVEQILTANPAQVAEYRAGKEKAFNFFVGQTMKATQGKANPAQVTEILRRKLST